MNKKKKLIIPVAALVALAGISAYSLKASADERGSRNMSQEIAEKFNLNQDEVDSFFSEKREQRREENQSRMEENLSQAVLDGKITEDQKNALIEKREEMQANREDMSNLSREERQEKRETHREEMKAWAEQNGIDMGEIMPGGGQGRGPEGRGGFGKGLMK